MQYKSIYFDAKNSRILEILKIDILFPTQKTVEGEVVKNHAFTYNYYAFGAEIWGYIY